MRSNQRADDAVTDPTRSPLRVSARTRCCESASEGLCRLSGVYSLTTLTMTADFQRGRRRRRAPVPASARRAQGPTCSAKQRRTRRRERLERPARICLDRPTQPSRLPEATYSVSPHRTRRPRRVRVQERTSSGSPQRSLRLQRGPTYLVKPPLNHRQERTSLASLPLSHPPVRTSSANPPPSLPPRPGRICLDSPPLLSRRQVRICLPSLPHSRLRVPTCLVNPPPNHRLEPTCSVNPRLNLPPPLALISSANPLHNLRLERISLASRQIPALGRTCSAVPTRPNLLRT
jgi:hypothetical protein